MWIYTVWAYFKLLNEHFRLRLDYFKTRLGNRVLSPQGQNTWNSLVANGFDLSGSSKWLFSGMYLASLALILAIIIEIHLHMAYIINETRFYQIVPFEMLGASILFCASTLLFISFISRRLRRHEYQEMLLLRFCHAPEEFVSRPPTTDFVRRWADNNNRIALFLIVAVPMTFSPFIGVWHLQSLIAEKADIYTPTIVWTLVVFSLAVVFHYLGVKMLINVYNGHLKVEADQRRSTLSVHN
ncbi:MAG: hypothetical protein HQK55_01930 [Deltaproteobacteria bacterium]|nr:hypothetical protein [Deltaproteobacteria bacterium]